MFIPGLLTPKYIISWIISQVPIFYTFYRYFLMCFFLMRISYLAMSFLCQNASSALPLPFYSHKIPHKPSLPFSGSTPSPHLPQLISCQPPMLTLLQLHWRLPCFTNLRSMLLLDDLDTYFFAVA